MYLCTITFVCQREIDGEVYVGVVKEKEKAREEYKEAVSSGKTAGLVKYVGLNSSSVLHCVEHPIQVDHVSPHRASGRTMEKFSVSVNIAAQSAVKFVLTYEELLQRKLGQYEILMRVKPEKPVQEFQVLHNDTFVSVSEKNVLTFAL